jgi:hypothetical protein
METPFFIDIPDSQSFAVPITEPETKLAATGTYTQYLPVDIEPTSLVSVTLDNSICEWSNSVWTFNRYFYRQNVGFRGSPTCDLRPGEFSLHSSISGAGRFIADSGTVLPYGCSSSIASFLETPAVDPFINQGCSDPGLGGLTPQGITTSCYGWTWRLRQVSGVMRLTLSIQGDWTYTTSIPYKTSSSLSPPWISFYGYFVGSNRSSLLWGAGTGGGSIPGAEPNLFAEVTWEGTFNCSQTTRPLRMSLNRITSGDAFLTLLNLGDLPSTIVLVGA